jgi:hypothetical protein
MNAPSVRQAHSPAFLALLEFAKARKILPEKGRGEGDGRHL